MFKILFFSKMNSCLDYQEGHEKAEKYKHLCLVANDIVMNRFKKMYEIQIEGYKFLTKEYDKRTNFKSVAYKKANELVICFVGTDSKCIKDHVTNFVMGVGKPTKQMIKAFNFVKRMKEKYPCCKIICAGHSEGGSEAQYTGLSFGLKTFTFNTFPLSPLIKLKTVQNSRGECFDYLINNYRDSHDFISKLFYKDIGYTFVVECTLSNFLAKSVLGIKSAHSLKNMGNCLCAIPIKVYKKEHPFFIDKIFKFRFMVNNLG